MKNILIDGSFVEKNVTGVQRFCWEILKNIVKYEDIKFYILIPKSTDIKKLDGISNLEIIQEGKKNNKYFQFHTLSKVAKRLKADVLCMSNFTPMFKKDYLVLHDVTFLDKDGHNRFLWALAYRFFVGFRFNKHKNIMTVSEFSKSRIHYHYKKYDVNKIKVVGTGGDHFKYLNSKKPDVIKDNEKYYLSVGSTTPNKNFKYVIELAKRNPDKLFIITGRIDDNMKEYVNSLKNMRLSGYLENEELKYLYENCEAFILPSTYEGFGLPPLEAIFCGCKKICLSTIDVFKEVYGKSANYLDPNDYTNLIDLNNLKEISEEERKRLTETYNWENITKNVYEVIKG